jgi:AbrB family looped-hinge helix DNA binding protein
MTYKTILTSKGTTTIPIEIRRQLGIKPGMQITFAKTKSGEYTIKRSRTIEEIRTMNKQALKQAATAHKEYKSGDGFTLASTEKFGK